MTNKDSFVRNLRLIIPSVDDAGSVATWGFHALDASYWFLMVASLNHPANTTLDYPLEDKETGRNPSQSSSSCPPLPSTPPLEHLPPHNHHTRHQPQAHHHLVRQEMAELLVDRKFFTGHDRGRLLLLLLRRLPLPRDLLREIYLLLPLPVVERIMTREG